MQFFKKIFYILLIQVLFIVKSINSFNLDDESSIQQISTLACSAVAKKMTESQEHLAQFMHSVKLFSEKIKYDFDQTKNFVNLIILNNCFKEMDYETAGTIIKQRAETKNIDTKWLKFLKIDSCFEDYNSLDNDQKKALFTELGDIKEHLKGLSENLGEANKASFEEKSSGDSGSSHKNTKNSERKRKQNIEENDDASNQKSSNIIVFIMQVFAVFIGTIMTLAMENIYMLIITIMLVFLVSLLGQKRLKKVKKVAKSKNNDNDN